MDDRVSYSVAVGPRSRRHSGWCVHVCVCVLVGLNSHWNVDSVFLMKSIM